MCRCCICKALICTLPLKLQLPKHLPVKAMLALCRSAGHAELVEGLISEGLVFNTPMFSVVQRRDPSCYGENPQICVSPGLQSTLSQCLDGNAPCVVICLNHWCVSASSETRGSMDPRNLVMFNDVLFWPALMRSFESTKDVIWWSWTHRLACDTLSDWEEGR